MNAIVNIAAAVVTASLDYTAFLNAMTNACKVTEKRNTLPVLSTVLLRGNGQGVSVTATNLSTYTTTFVPGAAPRDFAVLIDAHKLLATLKKAKEAKRISFTLDGDVLSVLVGKLTLRLDVTRPVADFPENEDFRLKLKATNAYFTLSSELLRTILEKVSFAISTEETRYYLNGIYMHRTHDDRLAFVATDGHRLARYRIDAPTGAETVSQEGVIIQRFAAAELLRLLKRKGCPDMVRITTTETGIAFMVGDDELLESKAIDGTFPDYNRVIPISNDHRVDIVPSLLIDAITQAASIKSGNNKAVRFDFTKGQLRVACWDSEFGTAEVTVAAENERELTIGFNYSYMVEILSNVDGKASLRMADHGSPVVVFDTEDDAVTYSQMPMRV